MKRITYWPVGVGLALALVAPAAAQAAAFPVNPGPVVAGRTIMVNTLFGLSKRY